jgi:hypothetical protein
MNTTAPAIRVNVDQLRAMVRAYRACADHREYKLGPVARNHGAFLFENGHPALAVALLDEQSAKERDDEWAVEMHADRIEAYLDGQAEAEHEAELERRQAAHDEWADHTFG